MGGRSADEVQVYAANLRREFRSPSSGGVTTSPPASVRPTCLERRVRRTALIYVFPAAVVAANWLRLERPHGSGQQALWIMLVALCPALVRPLADQAREPLGPAAGVAGPARPELRPLRVRDA